MSQIDQAFIKAYRTQQSATEPQAAPASPPPRQSAVLAGRGLRVDAPHVQAEPAPQPGTSQRVPTPHLQLTPEVAARLSGLTGQSPNGQAAPASHSSSTQRRSATFHRRSPIVPAPEIAPPQPADKSVPATPAPPENNYTSVEETLLRLVGIAESEQEPEEIQVVSGRIHREVEVARTNESVAQPATESAPTPETTGETEEVPEPSVEETVEAEPATAHETNVAVAEKEVCDTEAEGEEDEQPEEVHEPAPEPEDKSTAPTAESLQPAWEVDSFHWPDIVCQLQTDPIAGVEAACTSLRETVGVAGKMMAVSGVNNGVGATTVSLLLARGLAKLGLKVALVDADFENPSLAESLGVRIQDGWEAAIDGRLPLEEVCVASLDDGVTLVPLMQNAEASATKASLNAAGVLKQLRDVFDFVLIDAGTGSENVAAVATSSDEVLDVAVLLAVDERQFDSTLTSEIITHLKQFSIESIQMVQTFVAA